MTDTAMKWHGFKVQYLLWFMGFLSIFVCFWGGTHDPNQFYSSYLVGFLLWLGIALGCTGLWMLYNLVGGRWGEISLPILQAASQTLPAFVILFIPIFFGVKEIYPWAQSLISNPEIHQKHWYLNLPFFYARAAFCFLVWVGMALLLKRRNKTHLEGLSGLGIVLFVITISIASFDWIMSISIYNTSSIFGFLVMIGELLSSLAFIVFTLVLLQNVQDRKQVPVEVFHDFGNLLLTFVMLWAYLSYSQYLISWSGQMTEELVWYNNRLFSAAVWKYVGAALILCNFIVPFALLLFRSFKRNGMLMGSLAVLLLCSQWLNTVWLIFPSIYPMQISYSFLQILTPLALGAIWLGCFIQALERKGAL